MYIKKGGLVEMPAKEVSVPKELTVQDGERDSSEVEDVHQHVEAPPEVEHQVLPQNSKSSLQTLNVHFYVDYN